MTKFEDVRFNSKSNNKDYDDNYDKVFRSCQHCGMIQTDKNNVLCQSCGNIWKGRSL